MTKQQRLNVSILIVAGIIIATIGTVYVIWSFVGTLEDNSRTMSSMKTNFEGHDASIFATIDTQTDYMRKEHPRSEDLYNKARKAQALRHYKESIKLYDDSITEYRKDMVGRKPNKQDGLHIAVRLRGIAQCYIELKELDKALDCANQAMKYDSTELQNFELRAEIYEDMNKPELAAADRAMVRKNARPGGGGSASR